jgi:asparagine synthase (glutamine-hydrolysing)
MCGIAGFLGQRNQVVLQQMLSRLEHRGPDEEGQHHEQGVTLGVRRLCVIDPTGGQQPMTNETGTIWVVLNGEIYNYRELREELIGKGHRFTSNCDTEVLVHLYEQEGEEGIQRLRGMFAYALWDRERQTLLLVRDSLGIKPLYYALLADTVSDGLAFASELPALLPALTPRSVSPQGLAQYLTLLYVPGPGTIYEGIQQLRPGELLRVVRGRVETRRYFQPTSLWHQASGSGACEGAGYGVPDIRSAGSSRVEEFLILLRETVQAHLVSDVPLGLFLSGGLDSGAILAMMRAVTNGPIRSFSIGYDDQADRSYNELEAARCLAAHFGTEHTEERLRPEAAKLLPRIVGAMGEPFADCSAIPTYLVSEVARRSVTVALSGIGGDELFGGYPRYLGMQAAGRYAGVPLAVRRWVAGSLAPYIPEGSSNRDQGSRLKRFLRDGHRPLAEQYLRWVTFLPPEWGMSLFTPEFQRQVGSAPLTEEYPRTFSNWPSAELADRAMGLDLQTYLPDDLLRMGDRLSMAHSLELRVPFCDRRLLSFACTLPVAERFKGFQLKSFMRRALSRALPARILARPKFGFQVPIARWLREDLKEMVRDLLTEERVARRGYVRPEYVRWVIDTHEAGRRNLADQLYALLVLELWLQRN